MAQRKSTDIREAILLAKRESFKKSSDSRGTNGGGNSGSGTAGTTSVAATDTAPIKKEPTRTTGVSDSHTTDAKTSTVRIRNPVPTFSEGEHREKLKQKQDEESKASVQSTVTKRLVHSSMTAAAAAAAAAAGPTMAIGGYDDLGPEGAEAGSDDEGEEEIGKRNQHGCISLAELRVDTRPGNGAHSLANTAAAVPVSSCSHRGTLYTLESGVGL